MLHSDFLLLLKSTGARNYKESLLLNSDCSIFFSFFSYSLAIIVLEVSLSDEYIKGCSITNSIFRNII